MSSVVKQPTTKKNNMYPERKGNISWFRGCLFNCTYCAFGKMLKLSGCSKCKTFEPHAHLEVLNRNPPTTKDREFLTMGLTGDIAFATPAEMNSAIAYCEKWSDRTFLVQTKAPQLFIKHKFPENVILDCTIESDIQHNVSAAPTVTCRHEIMSSHIVQSLNNKKWITIEPIMGFTKGFADILEAIHPEVVYVGYDSKGHNLREPSLKETEQLIEQIEKFAEVRIKLLRKAYWKK